jgi:hypothetical protein
MDPALSNLLSGVIGALLGAAAAAIVGYRQVDETRKAAQTQATATIEAVRLTISRDEERAVRRERAHSAGLVLAQARLRVRYFQRLGLYAREHRRQIVIDLIPQLVALDARADDLLASTIEAPRFRAAAEAFIKANDALITEVVGSSDPAASSWPNIAGIVELGGAALPALLEELQGAADAWIKSPVP